LHSKIILVGGFVVFCHVTQFKRSKNIAVAGRTLLIFAGKAKVVEYPFQPPHEIMHLRGPQIVNNYLISFGGKPVEFNLFHHEDEIFADYFEAVMKRSFIDSIDGQDFLCMPKDVVNYSLATLVDTSILHLNLWEHHKLLSSKFKKKKREVFPGYKNIVQSRTALFESLQRYEDTGVKSFEIEVLDELLSCTNHSIHGLFEVADLTKNALLSLMPIHYNLRQNEINVRFGDAVELVELFTEATQYSESYYGFVRDLKRVQISRPSDFEEVTGQLKANAANMCQDSFKDFLSQYPDVFGFYLAS
jgi:hypothetical protein